MPSSRCSPSSLRGRAHETAALFLLAGVLGGYTTFSAFGAETTALLPQRPWLAAANVGLSVGLGLLAIVAGSSAASAWRAPPP